MAKLLSRYAAAAAAHGEATLRGDYRSANRAYGTIRAVWQAIRGRHQERALLTLLGHNDPSVRVWAASHCLIGSPEQAEPVLEELARQEGPIGADAQITLVQWRKGELNSE